MKQTIITCNQCGNKFEPSMESDYYTLLHKVHYMIPNYDSESHFCSRDCLIGFLVGSKQ